jgi:hypothetical protein
LLGSLFVGLLFGPLFGSLFAPLFASALVTELQVGPMFALSATVVTVTSAATSPMPPLTTTL